MRSYLLLAAIVILAACDSKKNGNAVDTEKKDSTTATNNSTDAGTRTDPPVTGKVDIETFGPLKLGQPSTETIKILGEPDSKKDPVEWAADGLVHQDWIWKEKGLVLNMSYEKSSPGKAIIYTITATTPCSYKTAAGLGIGSTYAEVETAYKKDIEPEATGDDFITVVSVYGGIMFNFKNNKADRVFLGAEAE